MGIGIVKLYKKFHQAAMIGKASNRNQKIPSFLLKNQNFHEKFEILKKRAKGPLGIGAVKLYKKFHQAAMIGEASNRNQKFFFFFA